MLDKIYFWSVIKNVNFDKAQSQIDRTAIWIYVIKHEGADASDPPKDEGITVEGVTVLQAVPIHT